MRIGPLILLCAMACDRMPAPPAASAPAISAESTESRCDHAQEAAAAKAWSEKEATRPMKHKPPSFCAYPLNIDNVFSASGFIWIQLNVDHACGKTPRLEAALRGNIVAIDVHREQASAEEAKEQSCATMFKVRFRKELTGGYRILARAPDELVCESNCLPIDDAPCPPPGKCVPQPRVLEDAMF